MLITEVFVSYQGEGTRVGRKTCFVRVASCNHAEDGHPCSYCDTGYSWYKNQGKECSVDNLMKDIRKMIWFSGATDISVTGGEPLLYADEIKEMQGLAKKYSFWIETNGSLPIWKSDDFHWSLDTKCPSSGNESYNIYGNIDLLRKRDQCKFVIANRDDFNFARDLIDSRAFNTNVIFQPAWGLLKLETLTDWMSMDFNIGHVVIGTQLQKHIWGIKKGV